MQVNINKDKIINGYMTRTFSNVEVDEFNIITSALNYRLQELEEKLEEYKESDNKKLREYMKNANATCSKCSWLQFGYY
jgi:hypothetical protein